MEGLQRHAGTAGVVSAALLLLFFVFGLTSLGPDPQPSRVLAPAGNLLAIGIIGLLASASSMLFAVGLYLRLRERAMTRAYATLYLAVVGLAGFALASVLYWVGGTQVSLHARTDQVGASHALIAVTAVVQAASALGSAFIGAAQFISGWAILSTRVLSVGAGWLGVLAGMVTIVGVLNPVSLPLSLGSAALTILWLAWTGNEFRRAP